jgi:NitT/TauT family transport system permease protein
MSPPGPPVSTRLLDAAPPLLTFALALALWQGATMLLHLPVFLVPSPLAVLRAAHAHQGLLVHASTKTLGESLAGFVLSGGIGTGLAFLFTRARWIERSLVPYAVFLQTVPIVAIAPLLVLWFGVGFEAVAAASFIVAVFPMITAAVAGLRAVDPDHRALFRLYRATRLQQFAWLEVPSALPYLAAGLRSASGLAVIGAVVGEFVAGGSAEAPGLGYVVLSSFRQSNTALMFASVLCCSALGLVLFGAVSTASRRLLRWHPSSA